jgi:hypothetical protein
MTGHEFSALLKKNPVSFGGAALSLALIGAIYFRSGEIPAAEAELVQKSAEGERYSTNVKFSAQLKEQHDAVVAANKEIDTRLVRASQVGANTQYFYELEKETGVKLIDIRQLTTSVALPKGGKSAFVPISYSVSAQGTLNQLLDLLRSIEGGAHYSRILTATCGGTAPNRGLLTLSLTLELLGLP